MRRRPFEAFFKDERGVGAIEFALVVPLFLVVYMMGSQIAIAFSIDRKVDHAAATIGDLVAQHSEELTVEQVDGVLRIAAPLLEPYPTDGLSVIITATWIDADGRATVDCSRSNAVDAASPYAKAAPFTLPQSLLHLRERSVIVTETRYPHEPLGGFGLKQNYELGGVTYFNPRNGARMIWVGC